MSLLEVTGLKWSPPGEPAVLDGVELAVDSGESVAILGPSGSGKSTILRCIVALQRPDAGQIRFRGESIGPDDILQFRKRVGLVAQSPSPVAPTVGENLAFAREMAGAGEERQQRMMEQFGLSDIPPDREFERLSVGEKQRLCFVRALTLQPVVLLLDEPTSALDSANVEMLETLAGEWLAADDERAAIWVTHNDEQAARVASRQVRLDGGAIA